MKVSKRSLIVSIAVLCVCALSLTAASFAWFTSSQTAKIDTLNMEVTARTSLQIRVGNTANAEWKSVLQAADFENAGFYNSAAILNDASTNDMGTWITAEYDADNNTFNFFDDRATKITKTNVEGHYMELPVEFRATEATDVIVTSGSLKVTSTKTGLEPALRMGFNNKIHNTNAAAEATYQPVSGEEAAVTLNTLANSSICTLGAMQDDGYCYGTATIYVWIEGSDKACVDGNTPASIETALQFGLAE